MNTARTLVIAACLFALSLGCLEQEEARQPAEPEPTPDEVVDPEEPPPTAPEEPPPPATDLVLLARDVSDCGGFEREPSFDDPNGAECTAETIAWAYDPDARSLAITNRRVQLNCCGEHDVDLTVEEGVLVMTETDAPLDGSRCNCMCTFDFTVTAAPLDGGPVSLRLVRSVGDFGTTSVTVAWEGELDLAEGSGELLVDEAQASPSCPPPATEPEPTIATAVSACGGFSSTDEWGPSEPADRSDYCDAEVLRWSTDGAGLLELRDERVLLNCCGDRGVSASLSAGVLVMTVQDSPTADGGRCWCSCVFDFAVELSGVAEDQLEVQLVHEITDSPASPSTLWRGTIDLSEGEGAVVVDGATAAGFCEG